MLTSCRNYLFIHFLFDKQVIFPPFQMRDSQGGRTWSTVGPALAQSTIMEPLSVFLESGKGPSGSPLVLPLSGYHQHVDLIGREGTVFGGGANRTPVAMLSPRSWVWAQGSIPDLFEFRKSRVQILEMLSYAWHPKDIWKWVEALWGALGIQEVRGDKHPAIAHYSPQVKELPSLNASESHSAARVTWDWDPPDIQSRGRSGRRMARQLSEGFHPIRQGFAGGKRWPVEGEAQA